MTFEQKNNGDHSLTLSSLSHSVPRQERVRVAEVSRCHTPRVLEPCAGVGVGDGERLSQGPTLPGLPSQWPSAIDLP